MPLAEKLVGPTLAHSLLVTLFADFLGKLHQIGTFGCLGLLLVSYMLTRCTYLLFFHPLAKYPGPRLAAISNVYYGKMWCVPIQLIA